MTAETTFDATSDTLANLSREVAAGRLQHGHQNAYEHRSLP